MVVIAPTTPGPVQGGRADRPSNSIDAVDPVDENYAGILGRRSPTRSTARSSSRSPRQARAMRSTRVKPEARRSRRDVVAAPDPRRSAQPRAVETGVAGVLRPGSAGADPAAPGGDPGRTLTRPRIHKRGHGAVPDFARSAAEVLAGKVLAFALLGASSRRRIALLVGRVCTSDARRPGPVASTIGLLLLASLGARAVHRGRLRLGAPDRPAVAARPARLGLLQRLRAGHRRVHRSRSGPSPTLLPVTHGIRLLQDLMLRGSTTHAWELGALALIAAAHARRELGAAAARA